MSDLIGFIISMIILIYISYPYLYRSMRDDVEE